MKTTKTPDEMLIYMRAFDMYRDDEERKAVWSRGVITDSCLLSAEGHPAFYLQSHMRPSCLEGYWHMDLLQYDVGWLDRLGNIMDQVGGCETQDFEFEDGLVTTNRGIIAKVVGIDICIEKRMRSLQWLNRLKNGGLILHTEGAIILYDAYVTYKIRRV